MRNLIGMGQNYLENLILDEPDEFFDIPESTGYKDTIIDKMTEYNWVSGDEEDFKIDDINKDINRINEE